MTFARVPGFRMVASAGWPLVEKVVRLFQPKVTSVPLSARRISTSRIRRSIFSMVPVRWRPSVGSAIAGVAMHASRVDKTLIFVMEVFMAILGVVSKSGCFRQPSVGGDPDICPGRFPKEPETRRRAAMQTMHPMTRASQGAL